MDKVFNYKGRIYINDKVTSVFRSSNLKEEYSFGVWLNRTFNEDVKMLPEIIKPKYVQTPDYLFKGEYWDLKTVKVKGKNFMYRSIKNKVEQSNNFMFDLSNIDIHKDEITIHLKEVFTNENTSFIKKILVKTKDGKYKILKRK